MNSSTINTTGDSAHGIASLGNSQFEVIGSSFTTSGSNAHGVLAEASTGNTVTFLLNGVTINSDSDGVLLEGIFGGGTINATITGSTITAGAGAGDQEIDAVVDGTAVICLNASGNTLDGGAGTISLNEMGGSADINVTQLAPTPAVNILELDDANGIPDANVIIGGTIDFNAGLCPTP